MLGDGVISAKHQNHQEHIMTMSHRSVCYKCVTTVLQLPIVLDYKTINTFSGLLHKLRLDVGIVSLFVYMLYISYDYHSVFHL